MSTAGYRVSTGILVIGVVVGRTASERTRPDHTSRPGGAEVAHLRLTDLRVELGGDTATPVLTGVDLDVPDGTRTVLLGASGAGKTTLLRAVAGSVPVTAGHVHLDGTDVTRAPSRDRDVAMVSQHGSLQPHLDVRRNLGFALRLRGVPRAEEDARVAAEAGAFSLRDLLRRRPATLSAGERHEVALARALVRPCAVLLMDEPFVRIDAGRRGVLRRELLGLQEGYGVTLLLATNDPVTARSLAERIAVLDHGRLIQEGSVAEVVARPGSVAVAELLLEPAIQLIPARVHGTGRDRAAVGGPLRVPLPHLPGGVPRRLLLGVQPHDLVLGDDGPPSTVRHRTFRGATVELTLVGGGDRPLTVHVPRPGPQVGDRVRVTARPGRVHLFDPVDGRALAHGC
jgi:multiple sugar transport system ATP-binding protein